MTVIQVPSGASVEARDVTDEVERALSGDGLVWLATPHTTAALVISEVDAELLADLERTAVELLAPLEPYTHHKNDNPNAQAHLFSSLLGTTLVLRVQGGALDLGTYQRLVFVELDGPREDRQIKVEMLRVDASTE